MSNAIALLSSMSPSDLTENRENSFSRDLKPTRHASLPLQPPVKSASQILGSSVRASMSSQLASTRYVQQCRALMDRQRHTFDEERALWNIERTELHEKIVHLEEIVRRSHAKDSSQFTSPTHKNGLASSVMWGPPGTDDRIASSGDEFWRGAGGKSDAQPTRTFSEPSNQSARAGERLPSIAEDGVRQESEKSFSDSLNMGAASPTSGMSGRKPDHNIDGITFKSNGTAPAVVKDLIALQSPSPARSPSRLSPGSSSLHSIRLGSPHDPYTQDAGHTPLARRSNIPSEAGSSDPPTPTQPEMEKPPLEPRSSVAKIPTERSNSYFPDVSDIDEDLELKEPLTLHNDVAEDNGFLHELDSKLEVAKLENLEPTVAHSETADSAVDQPEQEPKLRIKRSMNFGSQLGSSACGKGF